MSSKSYALGAESEFDCKVESITSWLNEYYNKNTDTDSDRQGVGAVGVVVASASVLCGFDGCEEMKWEDEVRAKGGEVMRGVESGGCKR